MSYLLRGDIHAIVHCFICIMCRLMAISYNNNHIDDDFLCANILEDRAQWRDKTKGLRTLVILKQCASRRQMDGWTKLLGI